MTSYLCINDYVLLLLITITYYYSWAGPGGRVPRAPQRGPSTWCGAGPGTGPGP